MLVKGAEVEPSDQSKDIQVTGRVVSSNLPEFHRQQPRKASHITLQIELCHSSKIWDPLKLSVFMCVSVQLVHCLVHQLWNTCFRITQLYILYKTCTSIRLQKSVLQRRSKWYRELHSCNQYKKTKQKKIVPHTCRLTKYKGEEKKSRKKKSKIRKKKILCEVESLMADI